MRGWVAGLGRLLASACVPYAPVDPNNVGPDGRILDDPASCIDDPVARGKPDPRAQAAVMHGISELGACIAPDAKPVSVLAVVQYASDGHADSVAIGRASTRDCAAIECVRRHLAETKAPADPHLAFRRAGADFVLRRTPPPDGNEHVRWDPWEESTVCTDDHIGPDQGVTSDQIRRAVHAQYPHFRACYESGLADNATLKGTVTLRFVIEPRGTVSKLAVIRNDVRDCKVVACLKEHMQEVRFPQADRASSIVYPLALEPDAQ